jgi:hypothetical protein
MDALLFPEKLIADESTRVGRMMSAGDIRVTVTDSNPNGYSVTVRFKALLDNRFNSTNSTRPRPDQKRNWLRVPLDEATHVFAEVPNPTGNYPDKVGTFYTRTGKWFADKNTEPALSYAAIVAATWLVTGELTDDLEFKVEPNCGVCGHTLYDTDEVERGIDTECYKQLQSRSKHKQLRFPAKREPSPFMVNKILVEIDTLSMDDQKGILNELQLKLN